MGGKTKQTQRTKNNAKPSSSSQSAKLLGTSMPTFVGFSAHSDRLVPFVPGFTNIDQLPDFFDANISPEFEMVLRKMCKRDPITKKKALQEFLDLVNDTDIEQLKLILPLWPKFYKNLATDTEHNVRDLTQIALQLLVFKCKRTLAPYLRQLVPVWIASFFDNYPPAASTAKNSFHETFAGNANRIQEVCLHCQADIMQYTIQNLTFHTAATLTSGRNLSQEEAEHKYHRIVMCGLRAFAFFIKHTSGDGLDLSPILQNLENLLEHQKFWSFAKNKISMIKAAWFELFYYFLQNSNVKDVIVQKITQLSTICFQNIDAYDPLIAPHVWSCILLIQTIYIDWYKTENFKKAVLSKLFSLLQNDFNKNAESICPNLLPFFSKFSSENMGEDDCYEFCKKYFDSIKITIIKTDQSLPKSDYSCIIKAYFECLRFIFQKLNSCDDYSVMASTLAMNLLNENILSVISWHLRNESVSYKYFFIQTSALVAYWAGQKNRNCYKAVLETFWVQIICIIMKDIKQSNMNNSQFLDRVIELIYNLHSANPSLENSKVTFGESLEVDGSTKQSPIVENAKTNFSSVTTVRDELKDLVLQLMRICLDNDNSKISSITHINYIRRLSKMFPNADFYASITSAGALTNTLDVFTKLLATSDESTNEIVVDIIFEILQFVEKHEKFEYICEHLLKKSTRHVQNLVLQNMLSFPLCFESEVRTILSHTEAQTVIINIAKDALSDHSKQKFMLLHKCFFETDKGDILINSAMVDAILNIISEPLVATELTDMVDVCCSFIAQVMPVVCNKDNSSKSVQRDIFLKLFGFSLKHTAKDLISEDTLWEVTTCWQDALSSSDIIVDASLLESCALIVDECIKKENLAPAAISSMGDALAKFIICSTENIHSKEERLSNITEITVAFLCLDDYNTRITNNLMEHYTFVEQLKGLTCSGAVLSENCTRSNVALAEILRRALLGFTTIIKLYCTMNTVVAVRNENCTATDDEVPIDYFDPNTSLLKHCSEKVMLEILMFINISSVGDSILNMQIATSDLTEALILELSEKVKVFLSNSCELIHKIKEHLLEEAAKEISISACRSLSYLIYYRKYAEFQESATILLMEELFEYFVKSNSPKACVNSLQYLIKILEPRTITVQSEIMRIETTDMWIKAVLLRCLVENNYKTMFNEHSDKNIIISTLQFITVVSEKQHIQKDLLLYNIEIHKQDYVDVVNTIEYINVLTEILRTVPYELTVKHWDAIRIGLSSWVLSVSKSIGCYANPKTALFVVSVYKLFAALINFIISEKQKSSTEMLRNIIDEWESLFAREVNLVLFKSFYTLCNICEVDVEFSECYTLILDEIVSSVQLIDYFAVHTFCKNSTKITLDHLCNFLLKNLSSHIHSLRMTCVHILRKLTHFFIAQDIESLDKVSESLDGQELCHFLNRFEDYIGRYDLMIQKYLKEFSFKMTEISGFEAINCEKALSYLLLWDCMIYACANSPVSVRSVYTTWLNGNKYEENFLQFLFRAMPTEILKNNDSKIMNNEVFKSLTWTQLMDPDLPLEQYVCHLYTEVLRKLPAVVRRWWNTCASREKTFVDKLTTNFVSPIICNEELKAIRNKKDKHENMQVTVHSSTREVLAIYSIDEARMELVITLAQNYPLGAVKVECGKQIGGRSSSRNVGMQLTIFLTHQNGSIFDGLTLWKNNLDKKFEGVEECYICYTVIHQDTCQLPKLSCKTCKKRFHGPCLYKWFTTSSKSTCPICRNVF